MVKKITFIGAGSMAEAIIAGIIHDSYLDERQIFVTNKNNKERLKRLKDRYDVHCTTDRNEAVKDADIIVLSMKPYDLPSAIEAFKDYIQPNQVVVSVLAGSSIASISSLLNKHVPIIRAMPNTSATIGYSATAIARGHRITDKQLTEVISLFNTIGTTTVVDEEHMHTVTGLSGSGPAYIYYLAEAMEEAAVESGLDKITANQLIMQTIIGAGEMLKQSGEPADILRKKITSPNGTTQAGLETLEIHHFQDAIRACVASARDRSKALGNQKRDN